MLLRAAIVILLMLNLGAAAWWLARPQLVAASNAPSAPVDGPMLRLVGEAVSATPSAALAAAAAPATAAGDNAGEAAAIAVAPVCLRFGPFAEGSARDAARSALSAAGVTASPRDTAAKSARGWKVSMPPFASREQATAMAEKIKAAGISDLYVLSQGEEANGIALGRFGGEDAARRREAELRAKGFAAQAAPLGDTPAQAWLDARLPAGVDRGALLRIASARPLDCAELR